MVHRGYECWFWTGSALWRFVSALPRSMRKGTLLSAFTHFILLAHTPIGVTWGGGARGMPPIFFILNSFFYYRVKKGQINKLVWGWRKGVYLLYGLVHSNLPPLSHFTQWLDSNFAPPPPPYVISQFTPMHPPINTVAAAPPIWMSGRRRNSTSFASTVYPCRYLMKIILAH